jgi:hypothetical protein
MIIDEEKLFLAGILAAYILLGGFFAWLIGAEQWSWAWLAVVICWPAIGFIFFWFGVFMVAGLTAIFQRAAR